MQQLVELQKHYEQIKELDAEVIAVFREERLGAEGLQRAQNATGAKFRLVSDWGGKATSQYSQNGFATYVIDKQGVIQAILPGTLANRTGFEDIQRELKQLATDDQ